MPLQIRTTPGLIGINTINARQSIEQPQGVQDIRQPKAVMKVDSELPRVIIDQYQCFAEAGLKNPTDLIRENNQWSTKCLMDGIARNNQEGDMLSKIEHGGNALAAIGENSSPQYDFNIDFIPKSRPKIDVTGYINIDWEIQRPIINYEVRKPILGYNPGKVEISLRQWPSIDINFVDKKYG